MVDCEEKMQRCHDYVEALEEERRKIQVFRRELPLCLELVTQAIETCKNQLSPAATTECSEHSSGHRLVLEEFIPIKRTTMTMSSKCSSDEPDGDKKKSEWLRSAQLWNQSPDPPIEQESPAVEVKRNDKTPPPDPATAVASSSAETVTRSCGDKKDKDGEAQRKTRRFWLPELHRRFLHALQQLGGSHTATPKQIRELMKVEGLTNDEVKSHLQKYRLHTRKPNSGIHNNTNQQAPQFLVVGGIWMPPADYTFEEATNTVHACVTNTIYAPVAAPPLPTIAPHPPKSRRKIIEQSHSDGGVISRSLSTSSSSHTTTAHAC